jgi:hypothetical protein
MLRLRAQASQDRKGGRHEQLLRRDVERIVYERGNALFHVPDLLTHRIDRQLEIARILLNGFERDFADPDEISWPERARSPQSQIRQCDRNGRPDCSDRALQRVVTRDIRHADPEHANQGCKEKQPKPAHQHVLSQIFPISMSALRSTCTSRTR